MRPKKYLVVIILVTIFAVLLVLLTACSISPSDATQVNSPSAARYVLAERVEGQVDAGALITLTTEPVALQATPLLQDGPKILESHCTQCHTAQLLKQVKKPRSEWEKTLAQMEAFGVQLSDTEKVNLLDYLAVADEP